VGTRNGFGLANALRTKGIWVQAAAVKDLKMKRQAGSGRRREVFAPVESLNKVITQWNALLELCEERVLIEAEERVVVLRSGVDMLPDLGRFRKALVQGNEERS
jgi:hypothetical protein